MATKDRDFGIKASLQEARWVALVMGRIKHVGRER